MQIPGLRSTIQDLSNETGQSTTRDSEETDVLLPRYSSLTNHEILNAVPPRTVVDQLITEYFSYSDIAPGKLQLLDQIGREAKRPSGDPQHYISEASKY